MIPDTLTAGWREIFEEPTIRSGLPKLETFLANERRQFAVFPDEANVFRAFELTPLERVRVVILGQDPYHDAGQAHGLSFSVPRGIAIPPSLRNIYRELQADQGHHPPSHGCLDAWAARGVLLLNTVLTVRAHAANSHRGRGWEEITTTILERVNQRPAVAFVLWGAAAARIAGSLSSRHLILQSPHPSPLSAYRGFFGSRPFSRVNEYLRQQGEPALDWAVDAGA
jgi:uracil-DNA glycosylase